MLKLLSLKNFLTIDSLTLTLDQGFTAFTGETGAGKSVLMEAIALAFGKKSGPDLVRPQAQEAHLSLFFELPPDHELLSFLKDQGFIPAQAEEASLLLKRIITTDGKSRCFINDIPATLGALKECGKSLIEIHGQFDRLLEKQEHRTFLDNYGNLWRLVAKVQDAHQQWKAKTGLYHKTVQEIDAFQKESEFFLHHFEELISFAPQENEEDLLLQKRLTFLNQKKTETLIEELDTVFEGTNSVDTMLHFLEKGFSKLIGVSEAFYQSQQDLLTLSSLWMDLSASYKEARSSLQASSSSSVEDVEERLHLLRTLARKHQTHPNSLSTVLKTFEEKKKSIEALEILKNTLRDERQTLKDLYANQAILLSKERQVLGKKLEERVLHHLKKLKLDRLIFKVQITPLLEENWTPFGVESIEFLVSANGESVLGSFKDKLSGGELSRVLLALKTELAQSTSLQTIIFDEIDSAMSGSVATHIGTTLEQLSHKIQVLVITHTPQVASCAQHHLRIDKHFEEDRPVTRATVLNRSERILEMARMLSGTEITPQATEQAQHFLENNPSRKVRDSNSCGKAS